MFAKDRFAHARQREEDIIKGTHTPVKEATMTDFDEIRGFSSRVVDLRNISDESAQRIAAMLAGRRQRIQAEAASPAKAAVQVSVLLEELDSEERAARDMLRRTEQKDFEKVGLAEQEARLSSALNFESHQRRIEAEKHIRRKQNKLRQEILRESFWNFAKKSERLIDFEGKTKNIDASPSIRETTTILAEVYRDSALPFATDPEECWQRGVTTVPSLQRPIVVPSPDRRSAHTIPPYHVLSETLRHQYWSTRDGSRVPLPTSPDVSQRREGPVEYRSTPFATFAHNFPFHVAPPEY